MRVPKEGNARLPSYSNRFIALFTGDEVSYVMKAVMVNGERRPRLCAAEQPQSRGKAEA